MENYGKSFFHRRRGKQLSLHIQRWNFQNQSVFDKTVNCSSRLPLHHVLRSALQLVLASADILTDGHPVHEQI